MECGPQDREGHQMKARHRAPVAWAAALLALAACSTDSDSDSDSDRGDRATNSAPETSADQRPTAHGEAYFLELSTGTETPLSSISTEDFGSGSPFNEGYYYAVSPDGSRIYWENPALVSVEARSDASRGGRVDPEGYIDHYAGGWSPDGTKFVYQRRDSRGDDVGNLYVEDGASGRVRRITDLAQKTRAGWWYLAPTFSPDSRNVIFQFPQDTASGERFALWSVPAAGGEAPTLLFRNAAQAATSSKPTYAFVRPTGDGFNGSSLVLATPDGVRTLVSGAAGIFEPKMSPDGTRVVFSEGGSIYLVDVASGSSSEIAVGRMAAWLDDDTLIVTPDN